MRKKYKLESFGTDVSSVFTTTRIPRQIVQAGKLPVNRKNRADGLKFVRQLKDNTIPAAFLDPQYRGVYEMMEYGNASTSRNWRRVEKPQMTKDVIRKFITELSRVLIPSGHLFLWVDKFHLCTDYQTWLDNTCLHVVDMITWNKKKIGLGYRTRHTSEFLIVLQKEPKRAKGVWMLRDIPDVWDEKVKSSARGYQHVKPIGLQARLIEAVTEPGEIVLDPTAGSYSVMQACQDTGRQFLGCDVQK